MSTLIEQVIFEAQDFALDAFHAHKPTPMVVGQVTSLFGSEIIPGTEEVISDGVCGFAWVKIKPARGPLVKYLKSVGIGSRDDYEGGYRISFYEICPSQRGSQSMEKKYAACKAFCDKIKEYFPETRIYAAQRMD